MATSHELLIAAYGSFNSRDIDAVLAAMHRDVDWPNGMEGGRVHGHIGLRDYWMRQWSLIDPRVEPVGLESDNEGRTVVQVHQVVRDLDGKMITDRMIEHVYRIEDGLIRRMDIVGE